MARNRRNTRGYGNPRRFASKGIRFLFFTVLVFAVIFLFLFVFTKVKNYNILRSLSKKSNEVVSLDDSSDSDDSQKNDDINKKFKTSFTLTAIGDIMCHNTQYWDAYNKSTDEYDFSYVFDDIKDYTLSPDITVANLETSFAGKDRGYSNYPTFNSPDSLAKAVADIGVDVISTAGNHCLDMGFSGLSRTIDVWILMVFLIWVLINLKRLKRRFCLKLLRVLKLLLLIIHTELMVFLFLRGRIFVLI